MTPETRAKIEAEANDYAYANYERSYAAVSRSAYIAGRTAADEEKDKLIKEDETVLDFFKRRALSGHPNIYYR